MNDHTRGGRVLSPGATPAEPAASPTRPIAALRAADGTRGAHCAGPAGAAPGATRPNSVGRFMNNPGERIIREQGAALAPTLSLGEGEGAVSILSPPEGERVG